MLRKPVVAVAPAIVVSSLAMTLVSAGSVTQVSTEAREASLEAWTALDPTEGFTYEVIAEEGSAVIRRRVLIAALEAERAVRPAAAARAALTLDNYDFLDIHDGQDNLIKMDVRPRRRHVMLVDG